MTRHGRQFFPCPERIGPMVNRIFDARALLKDILRSLDGVDRRLSNWLEKHGAECTCRFCKPLGRGESVETELRGALWAISAVAEQLAGMMCVDPESGGEAEDN